MAKKKTTDADNFPRTIDAAVELVLSRMSEDMKAWLRDFEGDEIDLQVKLAAGLTPGMSVRAMLGLWGKNPDLLAQLPARFKHPDSASSYGSSQKFCNIGLDTQLTPGVSFGHVPRTVLDV
jgi:hypothetical protein